MGNRLADLIADNREQILIAHFVAAGVRITLVYTRIVAMLMLIASVVNAPSVGAWRFDIGQVVLGQTAHFSLYRSTREFQAVAAAFFVLQILPYGFTGQFLSEQPNWYGVLPLLIHF